GRSSRPPAGAAHQRATAGDRTSASSTATEAEGGVLAAVAGRRGRAEATRWGGARTPWVDRAGQQALSQRVSGPSGAWDLAPGTWHLAPGTTLPGDCADALRRRSGGRLFS
ncbi:MAG TPA: hypothetical protein VN520_33080, partial [Streptomyces sp.]|uniref:hypothetical protein n=1 Tax=Streptomyces sp. TaxID=1931 RepID=UPI002BF427F6